MALVAYDYSDSESESELENIAIEKINEIQKQDNNNLFASLPKPKQQIIIEEDCTDLLKRNEIKKTVNKVPVKITIPALSGYNSDEEDLPRKKIKVPIKSSGLFAILPSPKCVENKNPKFDAKVVKQKNLIPRTVKSKATAKRQHDSDDEEIYSSNFFSFTDTKKNSPVIVSKSIKIEIDSAKPVKDVNSKSNAFFSDFVANATKPAPQPEPEPEPAEETASLEKNAVEELCGKRQKKSKNKDINFIDINAADVMPDPRNWRTKALTEEQPTASVKKGEEPSLQSRRKHQITYLAYQAKVNEQELKNQWALNRMTRKQTQAKYGF